MPAPNHTKTAINDMAVFSSEIVKDPRKEETTLQGYPFLFGGVPSETYGLSLVKINNTGYESPSGSETEFTTTSINRSPELIFLGAKQLPVLTFPIEIVCDSNMDIYKLMAVKDWLFDTSYGYRKLQICADYMNTFYFNCRLISGSDYIFTDGYRAISCTVECDASWAWEFEKTVDIIKRYNFSSGQFNSFIFNNLSADSTDMKPIIEFTVAGNGDGIILRNKSYNNREFIWDDLLPNEKIVVDNKNEIISSSTGLRRLKKFNKKFFRMCKGKNEIECEGFITELKMTYQNARRLGGGFY